MPPDSAVPNYLHLPDADLLKQCRVETFRVSGPGGQKRNKTDSAVRLTHGGTGLTAQAFESRSQHQNRSRALGRLREAIAITVRRPVDLEGYALPPELEAILPVTKRNRLGPKHRDYWQGVQALLDLFVAVDCSLSQTAERVGMSSGALARFLLADPRLIRAVNELRGARGLVPLR